MHSLDALLEELYRTFNSSIFPELEKNSFLCTRCTSADEGSTLSLLRFPEVVSPLSTHTLQTMCTPFTQKLEDGKKLKLMKYFTSFAFKTRNA
jgi:hypothetical protein